MKREIRLRSVHVAVCTLSLGKRREARVTLRCKSTRYLVPYCKWQLGQIADIGKGRYVTRSGIGTRNLIFNRRLIVSDEAKRHESEEVSEPTIRLTIV